MKEQIAAPVVSPAPSVVHAAPASGWIVDDGTQHLLPGQMEKSAFLTRLRNAVCGTADAALAAAGRNSRDCPYLAYWFHYYTAREAGQIERSLLRYAPEASGAASAEAYIPAAQERVRRGIAKWVRSGEIDVPREALEMSEPATAENPHAVQQQLGPGSPLAGDVRGRMETAFGHDFSRVRVHADEGAGSLSASLNARAFTVGSDIAFAHGAYQPGAAMGDALLAHELAHVVQQDGAQGQASGAEYGALEEDAGRSTVGIMASLWGGAQTRLGDIARNALPRIRSGLSLQRCTDCKNSDYPIPSTQIPEIPPDIDCSKIVETPLDEIRKHDALSPGVLGLTSPRAILEWGTTGHKGDQCTLHWNSKAELVLEHYEAAAPGIYDFQPEKPSEPPARCKGVAFQDRIEIKQPMTEKLKEGEKEHCEDAKRAWAKPSSRAVQALDEMQNGFCGPDCGKAAQDRFEKRMGYPWNDYQGKIKCAFNQSHLQRDLKPHEWHSATVGPPEFSTDCKTATYRFGDDLKKDAAKKDDGKKHDARKHDGKHSKKDEVRTALPEVGKHSSDDVLAGCKL